MNQAKAILITTPGLFALVVKWILKAITNLDVGLEWKSGSKLCNRDFADDIVLINTSHYMGMMQKTTAVE